MHTKLSVYFMFAAIGLLFLAACSQNTSHKTNKNTGTASNLSTNNLGTATLPDSLHNSMPKITTNAEPLPPVTTPPAPPATAQKQVGQSKPQQAPAPPPPTAINIPTAPPALPTTTGSPAATATAPEPETTEPPKPMLPFTPMPPTNTEQLDAFFDHANRFLQRNVNNMGRVNYAKIKSDKTELNALVRKISFANLQGATPAEKAAFYLNAYNILVIKLIVDHNLPKSPLEVSGFFDQILLDVAQKKLTLDQLQKNMLFVIKPDARLHFALVCAATDCPPLLNAAYMPKTLEEQLTQQTQNALNTPKFVQPDEQAKRVLVSKIFEWYEKDFTASSGKSVIGFINQYRKNTIPAHFAIQYKEYNWQLNSQ